MGDTIRLAVPVDWIAVPGLILGNTYSFQNTSMQTIFLRQQAIVPDTSDNGFRLTPSQVSTIVKEVNDIWVRSSSFTSVLFFNDTT